MDTQLINAFFSVFNEIGDWLVEAITQLTSLFWTAGTEGSPGTLTFLGVLAIVALGFSVIFLLIGIIQKFLHFRG